MLINCADLLVPHLAPLYQATFKLDISLLAGETQ